jgi:hypothetical protein
MILVESFESLPKGRPNWETYAQTAAGELRALGRTPRLTVGERILKRYTQFHQVDMNDKTTAVDFEARSATGRHSFKIHIDVDFRVRDGAAVVSGQRDTDQHLLQSLRRTAFAEAAHFDGQDYHALEMKLCDILDPKRVGETSRGPFDIIAVAVRVDPPPGMKLDSQSLETTRSLELRIAEALASGDVAGAQSMRAAKDYIEELKHQRATRVLTQADYMVQIEDRIRQLIAKGADRNSVAVRALRQQIDAYVTEGAPRERLEDGTGQQSDRDQPEPPRDLD